MMQHIKYLVVLIGRRRCILHVRAHISVAVSRRQEAMFVLAEGGTGKSCWASRSRVYSEYWHIRYCKGQRVQTREIFYCSKQESAFFKTKNQSVMSFSPFLKALRETLQRVYFEWKSINRRMKVCQSRYGNNGASHHKAPLPAVRARYHSPGRFTRGAARPGWSSGPWRAVSEPAINHGN